MQKFLPLLPVAVATILTLAFVAPADAELLSVDWAADPITDGAAFGQLNGSTITFVSTDGPVNGGQTFSGLDWSTFAGSDGIAGIGDPGVVNDAVGIDWGAGTSGFVSVGLDGITITNPILSFNFLDAVSQTFDFADGITLALIDQSPGGSVTIAPGNVVTTNGSGADGQNDGFSVELQGTFGAIAFATNINNAIATSIAFSMFADSANITAVPEPSTVVVLMAGMAILVTRRRK